MLISGANQQKGNHSKEQDNSTGNKMEFQRTISTCLILSSGFLLTACDGNDEVSTGRSTSSPDDVDIVSNQIVATDGQLITGKHFKCDGKPYQPLVVTGNNVRIEDSLFTDCYAGIIIEGAFNTQISGNRFRNMGVAIREKSGASETSITHNEFEGIGTFDCTDAPEWNASVNGYWACDVFLSDGGKDGEFNQNIVDNRGYTTTWIEDFVNLYGEGGGFEVKNNLIIGSSEANASSATGGCVIIDGVGSSYQIEGNRCFNAAAYGIGDAGGHNALFFNNTVYITRSHAETLTFHPNHQNNPAAGGSYAFGSTKYDNRPCGENLQIINNEAYAPAVDIRLGQAPVYHGGERNFLDDCPFISENNNAHENDPQLTIPQNVFENLDENYFSGRRGTIF